MFDLNDPDMKEIVDEFCNECSELIEELVEKLEEYEDNPKNSGLLENYGQIIDRMMGAAKTMGAEEIGTLCQMGKIIGYKASQNTQQALNEIAAGILFDTVDLLEILVGNLRDQKVDDHDFNIEAFITRLNWLAEKYKHIDRGSCDIDQDGVDALNGANTTAELEALISQFGKKAA
jgi:chemotaxis protein histidine kinase CheA